MCQCNKDCGKKLVSDEVIKQACRCQRNHSCLDASKRECCKVLDCLGNGVIFVDSENEPCPYKVSFGFSHKLCSCPVRSQLYRNHSI